MRSNANFGDCREAVSALTRLEARIHLVDDIDAALAANQTVGAVAAFQAFQRVLDFHRSIPFLAELFVFRASPNRKSSAIMMSKQNAPFRGAQKLVG